jgi:hypothetical protein
MIRLLWLLGYPDQACRSAEESLALAGGLSSPLSLAFLQNFTAQLYQNLHQPERAKEFAERCMALCDEQAIQLERAWVECGMGGHSLNLAKPTKDSPTSVPLLKRNFPSGLRSRARTL